MGSIIKKVFGIMDQKQRLQMLFLGVVILIQGLLETVSISMLLPVVSLLLEDKLLGSHSWLSVLAEYFKMDDPTELVGVLLVILILLFIIKNLFVLFAVAYQNSFVAQGRCRMISRVLGEFLNRPYEFYLDADIPTVFRITDSDIPQSFNLILELISLASEVVVSVFLMIFLLLVDYKMTLFIVLVLGLLSLLLMKVLKPMLNRLGKKNQDIQSRIAKWRIQAIYGIKDVKVLHRENFFVEHYTEHGKKGAQVATRYAVLNNFPRLMVETVFIVSMLTYILLALRAGKDSSALMTQLTAFGFAAIRLLPSVNRINTRIANISYAEPCLNYLYDNLDQNRLEAHEKRRKEQIGDRGSLTMEQSIELKGIVYSYPNSDKLIFDRADMSIPIGKSVGIMGTSGAGKSTIVDILLGLLHLQGGSITCDGKSIFDCYESWLSHIGYIPQSIYLIDESIRDNIAFGVDREEMDEKRIWEVLEEAQLKSFVEELPEGLDTTIGDRGIRLSGGQRQRIGIARALYHDPELLVFDEATSALDNDTEAAIMEAIQQFRGQKTMVIIAHRLNTIQNCDIIYKVEDGRILVAALP